MITGLWESLGWEGVGAVAGVIALVGIPIAVYAPALYQRHRKLSYAIIDDGLLSEVEDKDRQQFHSGKEEIPANEVRRVVIELRNDGGMDIEPSHYLRPISFNFGEGARVLEANIIREEPRSIRASFHKASGNGNTVALRENLLNHGDSVLLEIFSTGSNDEVEVDWRIAGVKEIVDRNARQQARRDRLKRIGKWLVTPISATLIAVTLDWLGELVLSGQAQDVLQQVIAKLAPLFTALSGAAAGLIGSIIAALVIQFFRYWREARLRAIALPPTVSGDKMIDILQQRFNYEVVRAVDNHVLLYNKEKDRLLTLMRGSGQLSQTLVRLVLHEAGITVEQFRNALENRSLTETQDETQGMRNP